MPEFDPKLTLASEGSECRDADLGALSHAATITNLFLAERNWKAQWVEAVQYRFGRDNLGQ